jgi:hypothetical protein
MMAGARVEPDVRKENPLDQLNEEDRDKGGDINAHPICRQHPTDGPQYRFRDATEELDDGIIRVGIDPGEQRADDDNPHVDVEQPADESHKPIAEQASPLSVDLSLSKFAGAAGGPFHRID